MFQLLLYVSTMFLIAMFGPVMKGVNAIISCYFIMEEVNIIYVVVAYFMVSVKEYFF